MDDEIVRLDVDIEEFYSRENRAYEVIHTLQDALYESGSIEEFEYIVEELKEAN